MGRLKKNPKNEKKLIENDFYFVKNLFEYQGSWNSIFNNQNPIEIEIGCGKGFFIIQKAIKNKAINYIAIDKFPTVLYQVLVQIEKYNLENKQKLENIKIVCFDAKEINLCFAQNEVTKCYLNFCDPWPKKHHSKRRLTNVNFLKLYDFITIKNGIIEFKTDNEILYFFTKNELINNGYQIIFDTFDLYSNPNFLIDNIPTEYEKKWHHQKVKIKKIIFKTK